MSHLAHESLWAFAAGEGGARELAEIRAHLDGCPTCRAQLAQVEFAQKLLRPEGAPPPLSDASARRIGNVLAEAAEAQAVKRMSWRAWWAWKPLALAAVAALLLWFLWPAQPGPTPPVALPTPEVVHQPEPLDEPQGEAQVTSARKAKLEDGALAKNQKLAVGAKVSTEAGGALWLKLPDGSRAGLTGKTEVTLEAMGERRVALEVKKGNLLVVAKHDPSRELRVYAGEVEVRDVGTRFLVAREEKKVAVAVEEGEVEVRVGQKLVPVKAGQGVEIARGRVRELPLKPPPEPKVETPPAPSPSPDASLDPAPLPPPLPLPPAAVEVQDAGVVAALPPAPAPTPAPAAAPQEEELDSIALAFKRFGEALARPFMPTRGALAERIDALASEGNCDDAHREAKTWLAKDAGQTSDEALLKLVVLKAQLRCYTRSGKATEAEAIRRQLPP
jgi:ferric-dicitrate binding protein FerR (iron transport regulator)